MDSTLKNRFLDLWNQYFPGAELPLALFYTDDPAGVRVLEPRGRHQCLLADLAQPRHGVPLAFKRESIACAGGQHYAGFEEHLRPKIEFFLSCGIEGEMEGERYKKTPELAADAIQHFPELRAEGTYLVFKRWDQLEPKDEPQAVVFFASPDVLAGLFTLANYDVRQTNGVLVAFSSGCGSIITYPLAERFTEHPRAILGMFDVSARPWVPPNTLSFALPMAKLVRMIDNMNESFLITDSWKKVRDRIQRSATDAG